MQWNVILFIFSGKAAILEIEVESYEKASGELLCKNRSVLLLYKWYKASVELTHLDLMYAGWPYICEVLVVSQNHLNHIPTQSILTTQFQLLKFQKLSLLSCLRIAPNHLRHVIYNAISLWRWSPNGEQPHSQILLHFLWQTFEIVSTGRLVQSRDLVKACHSQWKGSFYAPWILGICFFFGCTWLLFLVVSSVNFTAWAEKYTIAFLLLN